MVQIVGTYKVESQENYKEYLMSLGLDEQKALLIQNIKEDAVVSAVDVDSITALFGGQSINYPFNKEIDHSFPGGHKVKTTTTIKGNAVTFKTKLDPEGKLVDEKVALFTDYGVTITSTNTIGGKAVRKYKRV